MISLGMKGDMVCTCSLPIYKGTSTRHAKVISIKKKNPIFVYFSSIWPWNDVEVTLAWPLPPAETLPDAEAPSMPGPFCHVSETTN